METGASVRISYWAEKKEGISLHSLAGLEEFRKDLDDNYISVVQSRPGDLGGLHQFVVEFVSSISLHDFVTFLLEGISFDLIKSGTKALVFRPFISAYKKLKEHDENKHVDIEEFRVVFQDALLNPEIVR